MKKECLYRVPITVAETIAKAELHLPKGYKVIISIENAGYGVDLEKPDCSEVLNIDGGDGLCSDINEAICIANGFTT